MNDSTALTKIKLRPLLPRLAVISINQKPPRLKCGVPKCQKIPCHMQSHRQWVLASKARKVAKPENTASPEWPLQILPDLPISNPLPEYRQLFDFFVHDIMKKSALTRIDPAHIDHMLQMTVVGCSTKDIMAITALATAKFHHMDRTSSGSDRVTTAIYSQAARILRRKLNDHRNSDIDDMILCVIALASLDFIMGGDILAHQEALEQFVHARGGLHNLGRSLTVLQEMDRRHALYNGSKPVFPTKIQTNQPLLEQYGKGFFDFDLPQDIQLFCSNEASLVELFERSRLSSGANESKLHTQRLIPTLLYRRDQLAVELPLINARYCSNKGILWCIILAAKIVEYQIVHDALVPSMARFLVRNLTQELQNISTKEWQKQQDILVWMHWVLIVTPKNLHFDKTWVELQLMDRLTIMHGEQLLDKSFLRELEWNRCKRYVWGSDISFQMSTIHVQTRSELRKRFDCYIEKIADMTG